MPAPSAGQATRVVSCNTTSIVRTLTALKRAGLLAPRARDACAARDRPLGEPQGRDHEHARARGGDSEPPRSRREDRRPELDVVTMAVKVPETLAHLHYWIVELTRKASKDEVLAALRASSRIALIRMKDGLTALNTVKELMADFGRPRDNLYEVALWEDMLAVEGDEAFYAYMVDNQAIVIPETIDAIRALTGRETDGAVSILENQRGAGDWGAVFADSRPRASLDLEQGVPVGSCDTIFARDFGETLEKHHESHRPSVRHVHRQRRSCRPDQSRGQGSLFLFDALQRRIQEGAAALYRRKAESAGMLRRPRALTARIAGTSIRSRS